VKYLKYFLVLIPTSFCLGQQCVPAPSSANNTQYSEVTDRMRSACANWIPNDDGIAVVYHAFETDRQAGVTKQNAYLSVYAMAEDEFSDQTANKSAYITCMGAIIDEVWP